MRKRRTFVRRFLRCIFHQHILAETVGFEPTDRLITDQTISSRSRYDHFDTSPFSNLIV